MINPKRRVRQLITIAFGVVVAAVIAFVIATFSRIAAIVVFVLLVGIWVALAVDFARHQYEARGGRLAAFTNPQRWVPQKLPLEFRFITHDTPVREVFDKIGPASTRLPTPHDAVRYDWPDGRVIFVYPEFPASRSGRVRAIQLYERQADIPIDEII